MLLERINSNLAATIQLRRLAVSPRGAWVRAKTRCTSYSPFCHPAQSGPRCCPRRKPARPRCALNLFVSRVSRCGFPSQACLARRLDYGWIPFGDYPLQVERYREDQHGPCAKMTRADREVRETAWRGALPRGRPEPREGLSRGVLSAGPRDNARCYNTLQ
jgi:hypothetical protein